MIPGATPAFPGPLFAPAVDGAGSGQRRRYAQAIAAVRAFLRQPMGSGVDLHVVGSVRHAARYSKALRESVETGGAAWTKRIPLDVTGFEIVMDHEHVTHARTRHGSREAEARRGQLPVREDDIALVPRITGDPDEIESGKPGRSGPPAVRVTKVVGEHRYAVILEARSKARQLVFVTMMKWAV